MGGPPRTYSLAPFIPRDKRPSRHQGSPQNPFEAGRWKAPTEEEARGCLPQSSLSVGPEENQAVMCDLDKDSPQAPLCADGALCSQGLRRSVIPARRGAGISTDLLIWMQGFYPRDKLSHGRLSIPAHLLQNESFARKLVCCDLKISV